MCSFLEVGCWDRVPLCSPGCPWNSLCSPGWPQTHRDPLASAFQVLGLKVCTRVLNLRWPLKVLVQSLVVAPLPSPLQCGASHPPWQPEILGSAFPTMAPFELKHSMSSRRRKGGSPRLRKFENTGPLKPWTQKSLSSLSCFSYAFWSQWCKSN